MSKDLVYTVAIGDQYRDYEAPWWDWYARKYDVDFKVITESSRDEMAPHWERYTVFERWGDYDRYCYVDADAIVSYNAPNFFEDIDLRYSSAPICIAAVKDIGSLEWTENSIRGYQHLFPDVKVDWWSYVTTGFLRFDNILQKGLMSSQFNAFLKFYENNADEISNLQTQTLRKGFDQTPFNYFARKKMWQIRQLDERYSLGHLIKKDIWQNGMFVELGYVWQFNGFPSEQRELIMEHVWNQLQDRYL